MSKRIRAIVTPINIAPNVCFVHYSDLGLYDLPSLACTFYFAFFIVYTFYSPTLTRNQTWGALQLRAVLGARSCITFVKLPLPGILMFGPKWCVLTFRHYDSSQPPLPFSSTIHILWRHRCSCNHDPLSLTFGIAFEMVALAAARLNHVPLAAQSIIMIRDQSQVVFESLWQRQTPDS